MFESGHDGSDAQALGQLIAAFCRVTREFNPGAWLEDASRNPGAGLRLGRGGQEHGS